MAELRDLIDAFDRLVAAAADVAPRQEVERAAQVARRARARRGYLGETVVVALAGGTGSGKSSLVNALAGEEVAPTGARRPTTERPLAWIPADPEPGLVRLLDDLGIEERVAHQGLDWLAVIDLPDTDSVAFDHRATVERLLPEVDAVVWVLDPEKYQDELLHRHYLRPLAHHGDRFRFVLNQIDRVPADQRQLLVEDLIRTLKDDGIDAPMVIPTAADPPLDLPTGTDQLVEALAELGDAKSLVTSKLVGDINEAADRLADASGVAGGSGTGFAARWEQVSSEAARQVGEDLMGSDTARRAQRVGARTARSRVALWGRAGPAPEVPLLPAHGGGVSAAVERIDRFLAELSAEVSGDTLTVVREVRSSLDREVEGAATVVAAGSSIPLTKPPGWWQSAAWGRRLAALGLLIGLAWLLERVMAGNAWTPAVVVVAASLALLLSLGMAAARSGAAWGEEAVRSRREEVEQVVRRELDRRVGRPLRLALRERAGVGAALTELRLVAARWGE